MAFFITIFFCQNLRSILIAPVLEPPIEDHFNDIQYHSVKVALDFGNQYYYIKKQERKYLWDLQQLKYRGFRKLGMAILSVTPENPLLWAFLMQNFNLGIAKMFVIPEFSVFPNPVLPKTL